MKGFGKILFLGGLLVALLVLGRGLYYAPNGEVHYVADKTPTLPDAGASLPVRLLIPKLDIDADVQRLGITASGNMAAPNNFVDVSWYKFGTIPGATGSAVIAGHEDNALSLDGVFKHLEDLNLNDRVYVVGESGERLEFKVVEKRIYPYNLSGPELERIFNAKDKSRLNLITCAGEWLASAHTNDKRLVVFTELVK